MVICTGLRLERQSGPIKPVGNEAEGEYGVYTYRHVVPHTVEQWLMEPRVRGGGAAMYRAVGL